MSALGPGIKLVAERNSRELLGEFSSEDASEDAVEKALAFELRREWNGRSGAILSGLSRSASEDASDMATSLSSSDVGNAKRLGRFAFYTGKKLAPRCCVCLCTLRRWDVPSM